MIDSHQHFWRVGAFDYPWMSPRLGVLYRDYLPPDLEPVLAAAGVERTVLVQASPSVAETDFLLDLAERHDFIAGVVGWLDLEDAGWTAGLRRLRRRPKFVGLRPAVEFIPDDRWLARPRVLASLRELVAEGVPLDLIVWPRHLPAVLEMLGAVPGLRCVVDHLAKPDVRGRAWEPWAALLARVAEHPLVSCKLSGLLTQAEPGAGAFEAVRPYLEHALARFGPARVMFGSDWPVSLLGGDYAATLDAVRRVMPAELHPAALGGNAASFYGLSPIPAGTLAGSGERHAVPKA